MAHVKFIVAAALIAVACTSRPAAPERMEYARYFSIANDGKVIVYQPSGASDTLKGPFGRFACMSSSYVGYLEAIGADDAAIAVSGKDFLGNEKVKAQAAEIGYDAALDYEAVLASKPDLFLTYAVSAAEPPYVAKLKQLGIRTVVINEHLESHPLGRAEYLKLFGALTGREASADSLFQAVKSRYMQNVQPSATHMVLINIPYADQWFIPGGESYMTKLIEDAGGKVIGANPGEVQSSVISLETAYSYAQEADFWLHPGWCATIGQLKSVNPFFSIFPVQNIQVWNNTLQRTEGGGNRYWETGPARPDLIIEDLTQIFSGEAPDSLNYYFRLK